MTRELGDISGLGKSNQEKLIGAGITSVDTLAIADMDTLTNLGITPGRAAKYIAGARNLTVIELQTAKDQLDQRMLLTHISTSCTPFDELLGGGIETGSLTEIAGKDGSGKTQVCHQLAVNTLMPVEAGGLDKNVLYIDTEGTFRPERIVQMAEATGVLPTEEVLERIFVKPAYTLEAQVLTVDNLDKIAEENNIGLLVIDSLIANLRVEYQGRGKLAERQQLLLRMMKQADTLSKKHGFAVVVTNQVMVKPNSIGTFVGEIMIPLGGTTFGHKVTTRLFIKKPYKNKPVRILELRESPHLKEGACEIDITENGVEDI